MNIESLLGGRENKTFEVKRDLSSPDGVLRTLVAFANTSGGILLIGVQDRTMRVLGVRDALDVEERLASLISDNIIPRLVPELEILPFRRQHVLGVQVHPSASRPHHFKKEGTERGTYVRVGSTNRRADRELIEEMKRFARGEAFDEQAMPQLDSEAIDFRAASESFVTVRKLKRSDLATLRLVVKHQGRLVPSVGGMLLFGKDRAQLFPDAWIQAGRFRGTDKAEIVDHVEIRAHLVTAIDEAVAFVQKHALHGAAFSGMRRVERWNIPPLALRELLVNAVAHADYAQQGAPIRVSIFDDRLEVENPGLLPFGLTIEDLQQGVSKLRNRVIGRVFHELGLIESWGSGVARINASCRDAGLPPPVFAEHGLRFRVTLRLDRAERPATDDIDGAILKSLARGAKLSTRQLAKVAELSERATRTRMLRLIELGLVREIGSSPQDPKKKYVGR